MNQDATWYGGRSPPRGLYVRWGPSAPLHKGGGGSPNFQPMFIVPNGCVDQDATWYGGRPRLRRHCVRWGRSFPPQKGDGTSSPIFGPCLLWPSSWMDQDGTWHGGGLWSRPHCARWGPSSLPQKAAEPIHNFRPIFIVAKRLDASKCHLVWR